MKKLFFIAAVFAAFTMTSCQKSADSYLKEGTKLMEEYSKLMGEGKVEEAQKVSDKLEALGKEVEEKSQSDPEFKKEFEEALGKQAAETMKKANDAMQNAEDVMQNVEETMNDFE